MIAAALVDVVRTCIEVFPAISGVSHLPEIIALGVIESFSVASPIEAADAAKKGLLLEKVVIPSPHPDIISEFV